MKFNPIVMCIKLLCFSILASLVTSCATIITGTRESVFFDSDPVGSFLEIDGEEVGKTPCTLKLKKNREYIVVFKKEGYTSGNIFIKKGFEPVFLGNLVLGGPIGMLVDVCTGAVYKLSPQNNFLLLKPNEPKSFIKKNPSLPTQEETDHPL